MRRGTRAGELYVAGHVDGSGMNKEIVDGVDAAGPGVERSGEDHGERYSDKFGDGFFARIKGKFAKGFNEKLGKQAEQSGDESGKKMSSALVTRLENDLRLANGRVTKSINKMLRADPDNIPLFEILAHGARTAENAAARLERQLRTTLKAEGALSNSDSVSGNRGGRGGLGGNKSLGDRIGGVLGAGSRSNVLNLFGKSLGNIINLVDGARKVGGQLFGAFIKGFGEAGEGANFLQKSLKGLSSAGAEAGAMGSKAFSALAASGPAAAIAVGVVILAMSALVSVAGALLAITVALVSTIATALVGALAIGGGALVAVTAAAGLLTAAFMSMDDAQKKMLKESFIPLREEVVGLGQVMIQQMVPAFGVWSQNLQRAVALALPVAEKLGGAFAEAGKTLTASFSGPGFQNFATALGTYLPGIIQRLAGALGSFLNGSLGLFAALMPSVLRFADYLARVADRFSAWANSASGQNAIVSFADRATASIKALWGFITQFSGFIGDVLFNPESQRAGNSIFESMARSFEGFRRKFAQAAADGSLRKWYNDAIEFGGRVADMFDGLFDIVKALYNSGVLDATGKSIAFIGGYFVFLSKVLGPLVDALGEVLPLMLDLASPVVAIAKGIKNIGVAVGFVSDTIQGTDIFGKIAAMGNSAAQALSLAGLMAPTTLAKNIQSAIAQKNLIGKGKSALAGTASAYNNPYKSYAESIQKDGPSQVAQIKEAIRNLNRQIAAAITEASKSADYASARATLRTQATSLIEAGRQGIESARTALNSAASSLGSASSKKQADKALKEVRDAQKAYGMALQNQKRLDKVAKLLRKQSGVTSGRRVADIVATGSNRYATLADYAAARNRLAVKIDAANQKLADAIAMRTEYKNQVTDSIKSFGDLTTAAASSINGVEQALTAADVTSNLQTRLDKIKKFNDNLRILLAQGLSKDAYKQLVDAGVEGGSAAADALVAGGPGAVAQVNDLTQKINDLAKQLGQESSSQLYDAGVNAAKGLVDGLKSLSKQLEDAASDLGKSIAKAIAKALGIKSPSTVLRAMMGDVGDGAVLGLGDQEVKVGRAAGRLSDAIAVSPAAAASANAQGQSSAVSGNSQRPIDLTIITPTEDPHAVATETINELTGRL